MAKWRWPVFALLALPTQPGQRVKCESLTAKVTFEPVFAPIMGLVKWTPGLAAPPASALPETTRATMAPRRAMLRSPLRRCMRRAPLDEVRERASFAQRAELVRSGGARARSARFKRDERRAWEE